MKLRAYWKDAKSKAKAVSGVDAVKKSFFSTSGIGKKLDALESATPKKRPTAAKEALKAIEDYQKLLKDKSALAGLDARQKRNVEAISPPLEKIQKLLEDFTRGRILWSQVDAQFSGEDSDAKGMIVSIDPADGVIADASRDFSKARPGAKVLADATLTRADFKDAKLSGDIVLLAHGSTPIFKSSKGNVHATTFGGQSPEKIVSYLKGTLPALYHGTIYLDGCFTGGGKPGKTFAEKVYKGLVKAGYHYLKVVGNLGAAVTTADGTELVTPADVDRYRKECAAMVGKLEAAREQAEKKYTDEKARLIKEQAGLDPKAADHRERNRAIMKAIDDVVKRKLKDPKVAALTQRIEALNEDLRRKDFQIEGLTGTWGPEKPVPKK